jgi:4-azaleucine resistance transporter AzlC
MPAVPAPTPRAEVLAGSREVAPTLVGTIPFGLVTGIAAIAAGLTPLQGLALSIFAFSGIAQLVAMQLMAVGSPVLLTVTAATVVSLRLLMYSASLAPHLAHLDRRWRLLLSYVMTDQSFATATKHYAEPGDKSQRHWHLLGSSFTLWSTWQVAVAVGVLAGTGIPEDWSLDFVVVLTFIALMVPVIRTRADVAAGIVAAMVALAALGLPYRLALIAGSVAGIAVGLAIEIGHRRRR